MPSSINILDSISKINHLTVLYEIKSLKYIILYFLMQTLYLSTIINVFFQIQDINLLTNQLNSYLLQLLLFYKQDTTNSSSIQAFLVLILLISILCLNLVGIISGMTIICNTIFSKKWLKVRNIAFLTYSFAISFFNVPFIYFSYYQSYKMISNGAITIAGLLSMVNLIILCICTYLNEQYCIEANYTNSSSLLKFNAKNDGITRLIKIVIASICTTLAQDQKSIFGCFLIILLIMNIKQIYEMKRINKYLNSDVQIIYQILTLIKFSIVFLVAYDFFWRISQCLENFDILVLTITFLFVVSFRNFKKYYSSNILMTDNQIFGSEQEAIFFIFKLVNALQPDKQSHLKGYHAYKHKLKCTNVDCFCKSKQNLMLQKCFANQKFVVNFICHKISSILQKFPKSYILKFIYYDYKIYHSAQLIKINMGLKQCLNNNDKMTIREKYIALTLQKKVKDIINSQNQVSKKVNSQNIFEEETIKKNVHTLIKKTIDCMILKYKTQAIDYFSLNLIEQYCLQVNANIRKLEIIWEQIVLMNSYNAEIFNMYLFYYYNVIPSHIEYKKILEQFNEKYKIIKHLRGANLQNLHKYIYSDKTCTFQSNLEKSFGRITNVSKNCLQIIGIAKDQIIGKNINDIMPQFYSKGHRQAMNIWLENQSQKKSKPQLIQYLYTDQKRNCSSGTMHMKILAKSSTILFYATIIRQNNEDFMILNENGEIQGIGARLLKQQVFNRADLYHKFEQFTKDCVFEPVKINQKVKKHILITNTIESDGLKMENLFQCQITTKYFRMGSYDYYSVQFNQIRRVNQSDQNNGYPERSIKNGTKYFINGERNSVNQFGSINDGIIKQIQLDNFPETSSMMSTQSTNPAIFFNKFILQSKQYLIKPDKVKQKWLYKVTILLFILILLLGSLFFILQYIFSQGFQSFNNVLFGDGAVSDNNQMLQILYNNIMMSRIYCQNETYAQRCDYLLNNTAFISHTIYNLYESQIQVYLENVTLLSNLRFYDSYDVEVDFIHNGSSTKIKTMQFMEFLYYAIKQQQFLIESGQGRSKYATQTMTLLYQNWENMKNINHQAIYFYLYAGQNELSILLSYIYLTVSGIILITLTIGIILKKYFDYQQDKRRQILQIHREMCKLLIHDFITHYEDLKLAMLSQELLSPKQLVKADYPDHRKGQVNYTKNRWYFIPIIIFVLVITSLNVIQLVNISIIIPPCENMVNLINSLMDSENYALENYFQLKTFYMEYSFNKTAEQISSQIQVHLNQVEVAFATASKQSISLFSFDPTFAQDFNSLLIQNICGLTAFLFQPWQVEYCYNGFSNEIMSGGVVATMQSLQRNSEKALIQLLHKQNSNINYVNYFQQNIYQAIDDSIFYMFRIYQATQARMYQGLNYSISKTDPILNGINYATAAFLIIVILLWVCNLKQQKRKLSHLYGIVLQLPELIMKKNIVSIIQNNLSMDD